MSPKKTKPADLSTLRERVLSDRCGEPAELMARHGHQGEFVPVCEEDAEAAIERTEMAGKKATPRGATKAEAEAHSFANRDDLLPLHRRPFTEVERAMNLRCLNHLLGAQINA